MGKNTKKYILFGPAYGIGGWQLYINARCKHLHENNIDYYLIFPPETGGRKVKLEYIDKSKRFPLEQVEPYWYSKRKVNGKIKEILDFIGFQKSDDIFIESTSMIYSFWGELLAQATNGQNFCYILHSHTKGFPLAWQKFFSYKYDQDLIAGQTEITIPDLLKGYRAISEENSRPIYAQWDGPICDDRDDCREYIETLQSYKENGFKLIGYFGVLRKPHFLLLCDYMIKYSEAHSDSNFLFVAIGSSGETRPEIKLSEIPQHTNNCKVYNIPEMYPIPRTIFKLLDICLASWGSSAHAATACKRTIRIYDDVNLIPHGIIGINLQEPYHLHPPVKETMDELFDEILFGSDYSNIPYLEPQNITTSSGGHEKIDAEMKPFLCREDGQKYYEIFGIPFNGGISKLKYITFHLFGVGFTRKVAAGIRNFVKKGTA